MGPVEGVTLDKFRRQFEGTALHKELSLIVLVASTVFHHRSDPLALD